MWTGLYCIFLVKGGSLVTLIFRSKINDSAKFRQKYYQSIISRFQKENDMFEGLIERKMLVYTHVPLPRQFPAVDANGQSFEHNDFLFIKSTVLR